PADAGGVCRDPLESVVYWHKQPLVQLPCLSTFAFLVSVPTRSCGFQIPSGPPACCCCDSPCRSPTPLTNVADLVGGFGPFHQVLQLLGYGNQCFLNCRRVARICILQRHR